MEGCGKEIGKLLRRNRETGKMERFVDNAWVPVDIVETDRDQAWSDVEALFKEIDEGQGKGAQVAAGAVDADSAAGRDLAIPVDSPGGGPGALVQVDQGQERVGSGVVEGESHMMAPVGGTDIELVDEIPGLTVGDGRTGVRGSRGVLQRLRAGAKKKTVGATQINKPDSSRTTQESEPAPVRVPKRVEVAASAARARGPAVKDTTAARQAHRLGRKDRHAVGDGRDGLAVVRQVQKPAPGILSGQPKWLVDLFEAHFRSARTRELRHKPSGPDKVVDGKVVTPNRMKMSREDFAIGWLVCFEAMKREPALLRIKDLNGVTL